MKLTDIQRRKFNSLASSTKGTFLLEYLELIKTEVCDVRNALKVPPTVDKETRIAVCDVLDDLLINPLKRTNDSEVPDLNEHI